MLTCLSFLLQVAATATGAQGCACGVGAGLELVRSLRCGIQLFLSHFLVTLDIFSLYVFLMSWCQAESCNQRQVAWSKRLK